jgi:hypothetical protein
LAILVASFVVLVASSFAILVEPLVIAQASSKGMHLVAFAFTTMEPYIK